MAARPNKATKESTAPAVHAIESIPKANQSAILRALEEWLANESGYDAKVWPELKESIERNRVSRRKRSRD
jgi:hypothetical protein